MARTERTAGVGPRAIRRLFAAAVLLGAVLLFMLEPLAARFIFAGAAGRPASDLALLVYQAAWLAGWGYAAAIRRWPASWQASAHFALLVAALLWAPISLRLAPLPLAGLDPGLADTARLVCSFGPLAAALAGQAPLLQRWLLLRQPVANPFPLLGLAQVGGVAGLVAYMLLAPALGAAIVWPWLGGCVVLLALVGGAAATLPRPRRRPSAKLPATLAPPLDRRFGWGVLAAIPFALTFATAARQGVAAAIQPAWLLPFSVYLASLPIAFARGRRPATAIAGIAAIVMIIAGSLAFAAPAGGAMVPLLALALLFVACVALHAEAWRRRPDPAHLGGFHLALAGGALAGGAIAAAAPALIGAAAYPLLILAAATFARHRSLKLFTPLWRSRIPSQWLALWLSAAGLLLSLVCAGLFEPLVTGDGRLAAGLGVGALAFASLGRRWLFVALLALTMFAFGGWQLFAASL